MTNPLRTIAGTAGFLFYMAGVYGLAFIFGA